MGTMCLLPEMKSKIISMGDMSVPTKLAINFLPFDLHNMHLNVYRLVVHLPNEQTTYFPEGTTIREAMMRNNSTTLTGWCDFN